MPNGSRSLACTKRSALAISRAIWSWALTCPSHRPTPGVLTMAIASTCSGPQCVAAAAVLEWTLSPYPQLNILGGVLAPGSASRDLTGGSGAWTHGMVYARVAF